MNYEEKTLRQMTDKQLERNILIVRQQQQTAFKRDNIRALEKLNRMEEGYIQERLRRFPV